MYAIDVIPYNPEGLPLCEYEEEMPRNLACEAAIEALEDRILGRDRPMVSHMYREDRCDRCGAAIPVGATAAYFPLHDRLACAACAGLDREGAA